MCQGKPKNYLFSKNYQEASQPVLSCRAQQEGKEDPYVKTSVVGFPKGKATPLVKENNSDREQPSAPTPFLISEGEGKQHLSSVLFPLLTSCTSSVCTVRPKSPFPSPFPSLQGKGDGKGDGKGTPKAKDRNPLSPFFTLPSRMSKKHTQSKESRGWGTKSATLNPKGNQKGTTFGDKKNMIHAPRIFSLALQEAENKWNNNPHSPFLAEKLAISYSLYGKKYYEFQKQKRLEKRFIKNSKHLIYVRGNVLPFYQFILYKPDAFKKISQFFDSSNKQKFTLPIVNYSIQKIDLPFFHKENLDTFGKEKCKEKNNFFLWKRNPCGFTDTYFLNNKPNCSHVSILTSTAFVIATVEGDSNINYSRDYNSKEKQLCSGLLCTPFSFSPVLTPKTGGDRKATATKVPFSSSKFSSFLVQSNPPPKSPKSNPRGEGMQEKEKELLSQNNYVKHEDLHISDKGNGALNNFSTSAYIHNLRSKVNTNLAKSCFCLIPQEEIFNTENFGVFNGLDNFNWAIFHSGELQEKGGQPRQDSNPDRQLRNQLFVKVASLSFPHTLRDKHPLALLTSGTPSVCKKSARTKGDTESEAKQSPTRRHGKAPFHLFKDKSFTLFRVFSNSSTFHQRPLM